MYKRILLAFDGSECGQHALLECSDVANLMQSQIRLLAVAPVLPPVYVGEGYIPTDALEDEKIRCQKIVEEGIATLKQGGFSSDGQVVFGEPVDEIARVAKEWKADLIVIGHKRAASWAERWWRGSVSRSLVEISHCSVLVAVTDSKR